MAAAGSGAHVGDRGTLNSAANEAPVAAQPATKSQSAPALNASGRPTRESVRCLVPGGGPRGNVQCREAVSMSGAQGAEQRRHVPAAHFNWSEARGGRIARPDAWQRISTGSAFGISPPLARRRCEASWRTGTVGHDDRGGCGEGRTKACASTADAARNPQVASPTGRAGPRGTGPCEGVSGARVVSPGPRPEPTGDQLRC